MLNIVDLIDVKFASGIKNINFGFTLTPICVSTYSHYTPGGLICFCMTKSIKINQYTILRHLTLLVKQAEFMEKEWIYLCLFLHRPLINIDDLICIFLFLLCYCDSAQPVLGTSVNGWDLVYYAIQPF